MKTYELDSQFHLAELTVNKLAQKRKLSPKIYSLKQSFDVVTDKDYRIQLCFGKKIVFLLLHIKW